MCFLSLLMIWIRNNSIVFVGLFYLSFFFNKYKLNQSLIKPILLTIFTFIFTVILFVEIDSLFFGHFSVPIYNFINFNIFRGIAK